MKTIKHIGIYHNGDKNHEHFRTTNDKIIYHYIEIITLIQQQGKIK